MKNIKDSITTAPRTGVLVDFFEKTALGELGEPNNTYLGDINLFKNDEKMSSFYLNHRKLQGQFDKHFYSSIPFILEEECRVGSALKDYLEKRDGTQYLYVLGAAEGTMARTIGNLSNGKIKTLSCSPTKANQDNFFRYGKPLHSKFILSPYNKITNSNIRELFPNFNGFDVIIEDTTFQMYSPDRAKQIKFTKEKLKKDGIIGFIEKFSNKDITEFLKREHIKDSLFKFVVEILPVSQHAFRLQRTIKSSQAYQVPLKLPMISIVLPVYNSGETLYHCIASIAASSYPKALIQIIVANNHSTDNSFQVFHQAQADFPELRLQWMNTDAGKARALNAAIYNSMGSYIMNLDTDGWLEPSALSNMVLYFENNKQVDAATGTILTQKSAIEGTQNKRLKLLQRNEYVEYAQAFLSGRSIENQNDRLFTMSWAFSAFRREVLVQTYMYNVDTIGEDTDMTFQLRYRLGKRIGFVVDAIFYVEPISGLEALYLQRQRWQRGQIEVAQNFLQQKLNLYQFFSHFMIGRLMVDHTFVFPRLIWMIGLGMLVYLGYSPVVVGLSLMMMYLLYVVFGFLNYWSALQLLAKFETERRYYLKQWPMLLTLPLYNGLNTVIRLVGIINATTTRANWQTKKFSTEMAEIRAIIRSDFRLTKKEKK